MSKKRDSKLLARTLIKFSKKFEQIGSNRIALWLEKKAENFDKNLAAGNILKRF